MSATAILTTARLEIVPLDPDRDAGSLHAMLGDPGMDPFGWAVPARDVAETRERLRTALAANGGWTWAIRLRPSDEALGTIGIHSDQGSSIRGLSWHLRRSHWGQGIMAEAAPVVIDHLLAQPGITGVEAWIDTRNRRSIGVARRVVMARAAMPRDDDVTQVRPYLAVRDVRVTASLASEILGLHVAFLYPDPPTFAQLGVAPWSGSGGIDLAQATGEITPATVRVDLGIAVDLVHDRVLAAGLEVDGPPTDQPWYRRAFTFRLPEGHRIQVDGPLRPQASATSLREDGEPSGG